MWRWLQVCKWERPAHLLVCAKEGFSYFYRRRSGSSALVPLLRLLMPSPGRQGWNSVRTGYALAGQAVQIRVGAACVPWRVLRQAWLARQSEALQALLSWSRSLNRLSAPIVLRLLRSLGEHGWPTRSALPGPGLGLALVSSGSAVVLLLAHTEHKRKRRIGTK